MQVAELKNLPVEVRALVNDGVYSLLAVKNLPGASYVLLTNSNARYALTGDGDLLESVRVPEISELQLGPAIFCSGVPERPAVRINFQA